MEPVPKSLPKDAREYIFRQLLKLEQSINAVVKPSISNAELKISKLGTTTPVNVYATSDAFGLAENSFVGEVPSGAVHAGKEGYTLHVESRPAGSGDPTVPGSDFAIGISAVKDNWQSSSIEGQLCGINIVTRGGYFNQARTIVGASKANPCVITTSGAHGWTTGDVVIIQGVGGMFQLNAPYKFTITVLTSTTFSLNGIDSTGYNTFTSGGIVQKDSGVANFYNGGDTAAIVTNTVQASANSFNAVLEGVSYYMPSGAFVEGTRGIRVQLGAIKQAENIGIGALVIAANGSLGAAFQAQNVVGGTGGDGQWTKFLSYIPNFGAGGYEAFSVNQLGNIVLHGGTSATTPKKLLRANSVNGQFEIVNDAMSQVIFKVTDSGSVNIPASQVYAINNTQVLGPRIGGWGTPVNGSRIANFDASTATLSQTAQALAQLIADFKTHGALGV